jgi:hypothetical protein
MSRLTQEREAEIREKALWWNLEPTDVRELLAEIDALRADQKAEIACLKEQSEWRHDVNKVYAERVGILSAELEYVRKNEGLIAGVKPVFKVGDQVSKVGGDYRFDGVVVSVFAKISGQIRLVVEDDRGILHVYSEKNLKLREG